MSKRMKHIVVALGFGVGIAAIGIAAFDNDSAASASASVSGLTPQHACEVSYINNPRPHWCDRRGHVHWR